MPYKDPIAAKAHARAYAEKNSERLKAYKHAWHSANRERLAIKKKVYRAANAERIHAHDAAYYTANKTKISEYYKGWRLRNRDYLARWTAEYNRKTANTRRAKAFAWRAANRDKVVHAKIRRRVRLLGNGGTHTLAERQAKFALLGNVCYYCWEPRKLTVDHDLPLVRGGTNGIDNILPACKPCNSRKGRRTSAEFMFREA